MKRIQNFISKLQDGSQSEPNHTVSKRYILISGAIMFSFFCILSLILTGLHLDIDILSFIIIAYFALSAVIVLGGYIFLVCEENEVWKGVKKEFQIQQKRKEFYDECRKFNIFSENWINSPEKCQRLRLIAQKHNIVYVSLSELQNIYEKEKKMLAPKEEAENQQRLHKQQADEQKLYDSLVKYAKFHGVNKTQAMLQDRLNDLQKKIVQNTPTLSKQRESDGIIAAGIAYGLGGGVPALSSLQRTEQKNAQIRKQNAQIDQINQMLLTRTAQQNWEVQQYIERIESFKNRTSTSLINDDKNEVFSHLTFSEPKVSVTSTGTVEVEVVVTADDNLQVFNRPAIADGSITALIYDGEKVIGRTLMVFPIFGTGNAIYRYRVDRERETLDISTYRKISSVKLHGICLFSGKSGRRYTVKFYPNDLWAMEK